jgi:predicted RNase H-like HicB family nuclease
MKAKIFSLARYVEEALKQAEYSRDEHGVVVATVPQASGFFAQGDSFEEARANLCEVIEGNVLLALQLGFHIPPLQGIAIEERQVASPRRKQGQTHPT